MIHFFHLQWWEYDVTTSKKKELQFYILFWFSIKEKMYDCFLKIFVVFGFRMLQ